MVRTAISAAVVGALLLCASPSLAQDAPGGFLYVVTAEVKPGMFAAYGDFIKKVQDATTGAPETVLVFQRVLGGSNGTFVVAIPFSEWSEMDGWMPVPQILTKAYGETEAAELLQASGEMLDSLSLAARGENGPDRHV